jgi:hypothetical protein
MVELGSGCSPFPSSLERFRSIDRVVLCDAGGLEEAESTATDVAKVEEDGKLTLPVHARRPLPAPTR